MTPTHNSKIKNDELQVLMDAFSFTKEQLEQNRRGNVPPSQIAGAIIGNAILLGIFWVLIINFNAYSVRFALEPIGLQRFVPLVIALVADYVIIRMSYVYAKVFLPPHALSMSGNLKKRVFHDPGYSTKYFVSIEGVTRPNGKPHEFKVSKQQIESLTEGKSYRIYYLANWSRKMISVEPVM